LNDLVAGHAITSCADSRLDVKDGVDDVERLLLKVDDVGVLIESEDLWVLCGGNVISVTSELIQGLEVRNVVDA
jgi:hypothetical protein